MSRRTQKESYGSRAMGFVQSHPILTGGFLFIGMLSVVNAVGMSEEEKQKIKEELGPYFDQCMKAATEIAFCITRQWAETTYGMRIGASGEVGVNSCADADHATVFNRYGIPAAYHGACEAASTLQAPPSLRLRLG